MDYLNATTCTNVPIYNFATSCVPNTSYINLTFTINMCRCGNVFLYHDLVPTVRAEASDSTITNLHTSFADCCSVFIETESKRIVWGPVYCDYYLNPSCVNTNSAQYQICFGVTDLCICFQRNNICYSYIAAFCDIFRYKKCDIAKCAAGQPFTNTSIITIGG